VKGFPALCFPEVQRLEPLDQFAGRTCIVGRDPSANILIPDPTCSRQQFSISLDGGHCQLLPLSENVPTLHNGVPLSAAVKLAHKDQITCGFTTVVFLERDSKEFASAQSAAGPSSSRNLNALNHTGEIPADRDCDLGRAPGANGIVLDHPRVSRRHAGIRIRDGRSFVIDFGSSNGTYLNGERITGLRELNPTDRIDLGPFSFVFNGRSLVPSTRESNLRVIGRNLTRVVRDRATGQSKCILHDVSVVVEPGEFVCILGSSGSGKTTLMQALSARSPASEGSVFLNDQSLYANFQALKQSVALVPQRDVLYEDLTLQECIAYTARLRLPADMSPQDVNQFVERAIERVGLAHRRSTPIRHLSGGQKKRAALANEAVSQPELLFLDEVTSGLDEGTDWEMMGLFRHLANQGTTIICITHTVANVEEFCHKIVVMAPPGVLAYYGKPADAKEYFEIDNLGEIYRKLPASPAEHWRDRYRAAADHQRYIGRPLTSAHLDQTQPVRSVHQRGRLLASAGEVSRLFLSLT
jgi:ABC-type multidrug transport system ATPase subunit/pSer/pThr/pTyr-binding forkhead associated (FHA) protein